MSKKQTEKSSRHIKREMPKPCVSGSRSTVATLGVKISASDQSSPVRRNRSHPSYGVKQLIRLGVVDKELRTFRYHTEDSKSAPTISSNVCKSSTSRYGIKRLDSSYLAGCDTPEQNNTLCVTVSKNKRRSVFSRIGRTCDTGRCDPKIIQESSCMKQSGQYDQSSKRPTRKHITSSYGRKCLGLDIPTSATISGDSIINSKPPSKYDTNSDYSNLDHGHDTANSAAKKIDSDSTVTKPPVFLSIIVSAKLKMLRNISTSDSTPPSTISTPNYTSKPSYAETISKFAKSFTHKAITSSSRKTVEAISGINQTKSTGNIASKVNLRKRRLDTSDKQNEYEPPAKVFKFTVSRKRKRETNEENGDEADVCGQMRKRRRLV